MTWFLKITGLSKIGGILVAVGAALAGLFLFGQSKKREGRKEGFQKENTLRNKESKDAKERMDRVPDPTDDDLDDKLSNDKF
jgi:hypothetical protein